MNNTSYGITPSNIFAILGGLTCLTGKVSATGIEQAYHDAQAAALGNAVSSRIDTAAAVHFNPAGLALIDRTELQATFFGTWAETDFQGAAFSTTSNQGFTPSGSLFFASPLPEDWGVVGLGLTLPHGLSSSYPEDSDLRNLAIDATLIHARLTGSYARSLSDTLRIGFGLVYAYDDLETRQGIAVPGDSNQLSVNGSSWGWSFGLQWEPHPQHAVGFTFRSGLEIEHSGTLTTTTVLPTAQSFASPAESEIDYPDQYVLSYSWQATPALNLGIDVQWTDWSSFDEFSASANTPLGTLDLSVPWDYQPGLIIGVGAEYTVNPSLTLRGGYLFGESTIPDETLTPFVPDSDLHVFSLGAQWDWQDWSLAATYLYGLREEREVQGSPSDALTGTISSDGIWNTDGHTTLITLTRRF